MTGRERQSAFTLIETLLSLVVMSIIVVAMTSAMRLMLRAASNSAMTPTSTRTSSRAAVDQIVDDMKLALTIPEQSATAVTMTVPDRDGDNQSETIRYAWSGVSGDPVTRAYNGGTPMSIADNVTSFNVQHILRTIGPAAPPPAVESSEQLLAASDALLSVSTFGIKVSNGTAQYFCPTLPANAVSWKITRIRAEVMRNGNASSNIQFDVTAADSSFKPTGSALDSGTIALTTIGTGQTAWVEFPCTNISSVDPGTGLCLVAKSSSPSVAYYTRYATASLSGAGYWMVHANNGPWNTPTSLQTMQFYVYGTVTVQP